jgi:hypothetical protein
MKTYFENWKFKHPDRYDFISTFNAVVSAEHGDKFGPDLNWFFDQVIYGTETCDYAVGALDIRKVKSPLGYLDTTDDCISQTDDAELFESKIILRRLGDMKLPVEVLISFDNGEQVLEHWDGNDRSHDFIFEGESKVTHVEIDPEKKIWIDCNFNNNSRSVQPQSKGVRKYWLKAVVTAQRLMETITSIL